MLTLKDPDYVPESAGEHEAYRLMNMAIEAGNCEAADYPRLVENMQNIPRSYTFMIGGTTPTFPRQTVRVRGYVLPDGTLELIAIAHDKNVCIMKRRGEQGETSFMDSDLWQTTIILLFGHSQKGKL